MAHSLFSLKMHLKILFVTVLVSLPVAMAKEIFYSCLEFWVTDSHCGRFQWRIKLSGYMASRVKTQRERETSLCVTAALLVAWFSTQLRNDVVLLSGTKKNLSQEFPCVNLIQTVSRIPGVRRSCQVDNWH